jgi:dTDP-4-dehydrorhamnose reductase
MKVAVVGATGQLGSDVAQAFGEKGDAVCSLSHGDLEISSIDSVSAVMRSLHPELIINAAAMHHVERCEQDPEGAFSLNALGPANLAMVARDLHATLLHISTDYVFDGAKKAPYVESDIPRPLNTYGITKLAGEQFVRCTLDRHFVLRTSALYGKHPCRGKGGLNFVELMLKVGKERGKVRVVNSEEITPTSTYELARQIVRISRTDKYGLFHATAEGSCTWYEFAREIFSIAHMPVTVEVADPQEFPAKVARPSYSVLNNFRLKECGMNHFSPWQQGLYQYLGGAWQVGTVSAG